MFGEANAMANGNPTHLGYFSGQTFNRGFPQYVRKFNAAFLSLPALPATLVKGATSDSKVVMKEIKTENHGTYYAVVNTSFSPISQVKITFPASGKITNAATGQDTGVNDNNLTLDFIASELKAFRIQ